MFRVAMTIMRHREVGAQEAAFRNCHLFLRYSSRAAVFLPTFMKDKRVRMVDREYLAQEVVPKFRTNIIDRYMARPPFLDPICLYEFASIWALAPASKNEGNDDEDLIEFPQKLLHLETSGFLHKCIDSENRFLGKIFRRRMPAVVKYPNFHPVTDRDAYYYSLILMYLPFRKEDFCDESAPSVVFQQKHPEFRTSVHSPVIRRDLCEEIDRAMLRIAELTENENDDANIECPFDPPFEDNLLDIPSQQEVFPEVAPNINITETVNELYRGLNVQQKSIFHKVHAALSSTNTFRLLVQAEGGTGKTHCLKTLTLLIRNYWPGN
ncbi:hypothetical protein Fcan01_14390 [Folsomia candida]|uniref:DNA helicase n=1 Tax=Folsomia candida TaxID=158441 RepID=A0A226DZN4_FOLCA|nr:hypothetical protein Fcan01_14390 [Folsomia candida]